MFVSVSISNINNSSRRATFRQTSISSGIYAVKFA